MAKPLPDLTKVFERLFARPAGKPLVAGHALFQKKAPGAAPAPSTTSPGPLAPATPGAPARRFTPPLWMTRMATSLTSLQGRRSAAVVGLDLGASAIKVVRTDRTEGTPRVVGVACDEYPARVEAQQREQFLQERLREFKRQGLLDGQLVLTCADPKVAFELVTIPKMPIADLGRAVVWEAKERLSADAETYSVRYVLAGETIVEGQPHYEVLIVAAPRQEVISAWRSFSEQGYHVLAVEPAILAAAAACEQAGLWRPQEFVGLLEIGRLSSTLAFVVQGTVRFVRTFPVAGDSITQSIVDYCQLDVEAAEQQKREIGLSQMALEEDRRVEGLEREPRVRVSHALGLYLERLSAEVEHSLRYFTYELGHAKNQRFERLYLVGGGALLKNLAPFLQSRLNAQIEVADPFAHCAVTPQVRQQVQDGGRGVRLAAALGLALRPVK